MVGHVVCDWYANGRIGDELMRVVFVVLGSDGWVGLGMGDLVGARLGESIEPTQFDPFTR